MKTELGKISILMSIYNGEKTMDKAIESILNQTYSYFEFIICDDCSTDNTWEKLVQMKQFDDRILLLRNQTNLGLAASLNRCLSVSSGDYIARQDADDFSFPDRLEKTLNFLLLQKVPYAACGVLVSDESGVWSRRMYPMNITIHDIVKHNPFFHPTMIFRREIIDEVGGYRVSRETTRTEDYDLVMRLASKQIIGKNLQEYLYDVSENREDYKKKHRRKTRVFEFITRLHGYRAMKVPYYDYVFLLKPLLMCCIPLPLLNITKKIQWSNNRE